MASGGRWAEARPHLVLKELIRCLDFIVSFSMLALLTFEAEGFLIVGTVLYLLDPLANHASLPPLVPPPPKSLEVLNLPGKEPLV